MNRADILAFAAQGAAVRQQVLGDPKPATFEGRPLCVTRTSIEHRREIEPGGFEPQPECVVRVAMALHPWFLPTEEAAYAAVGKLITVDGRSLKIITAKRVALAGEIVLSLGKA